MKEASVAPGATGGTVSKGGPEPLAAFAERARVFLEERASRRPVVGSDASPTNGSRAIFRGATVAEADAARAWQRELFDAGLAWITGPVEYGGRGLERAHQRAFLALEREYDVPSKAPLSISLGMVGPTLLEHGTEEARRRWLPALFRGDAVGCQLFSEPDAGSDLAGVTTGAVRDGSGWRLTGQKVWTSGAHYSDVGLALARTAPGPRHHNLTAFLVELDTDGVEVRPLRQMTGGADFNEVFLDDVAVPDAHRLGEVDAGWSVALASLMHERSSIGGATSGGTGIFKVDALLAWARDRGRLDEPEVADAYARVYAGVTAAKAMRRRAEVAVRAGQSPGPEMSLSKLALTSNLQALSDLVSVVLGPRLLADTGEADTWAWSEFVLGVPGMRIGGGTDEIQRNTIAERVLGLPKEPSARPS